MNGKEGARISSFAQGFVGKPGEGRVQSREPEPSRKRSEEMKIGESHSSLASLLCTLDDRFVNISIPHNYIYASRGE